MYWASYVCSQLNHIGHNRDNLEIVIKSKQDVMTGVITNHDIQTVDKKMPMVFTATVTSTTDLPTYRPQSRHS